MAGGIQEAGRRSDHPVDLPSGRAPAATVEWSRPAERPAPPLAGAPTSRGTRLRRVLFVSDALSLVLAAAVTMALTAGDWLDINHGEQLVAFALSSPVWFFLAQRTGLYHLTERHVDHTLAEELGPTFITTTVWAWILYLVTSGLMDTSLQAPWLAVLWTSAIVTTLVGRAITRRVTRDRAWYRQRILLIGDQKGIEQVLRRVRRHPEFGLEPSGYIVGDGAQMRVVSLEQDRAGADGAISATPAAVLQLVRASGVDRVFITGWGKTLDERTELIRRLATAGIYVDLVSGEPEALCAGASVHHIEGLPILTVRPTQMTRVSRGIKRVLDLSIAGAGLVLLSPLLAYIAIRIRRSSPGPVLFRHKRAGLDGKTFEMIKFRTMVDGAEGDRADLRGLNGGVHPGLFKLRQDPRITPYGAKLRQRSLDELPQLWNVLRGDMSIVGPRPLPLDEAPLAVDHFAARVRVRPGITGPWQIHGRSDIPFEDMVKLDYTYATTWSLHEDFRLLIRTVGVVLTGRGAY